jgi:hypothetical protein
LNTDRKMRILSAEHGAAGIAVLMTPPWRPKVGRPVGSPTVTGSR